MENLLFHGRSNEPAPSLHLGVPTDSFSAAILPLLADVPGLQVTTAPLESIAEGHGDGQFDAALLPLHIALQQWRQPIVPGVGVAAGGHFRGATVHLATTEEAIRRITHGPADLDSALCYALSLEARFRHRVACVEGSSRDGISDAVVQPMNTIDSCGALSGIAAKEISIAGAWHEATGLPLVFRVWACRHRAPFSQLRWILGQAHRALPAAPYDFEALEETGRSEVENRAGLYYQLGSRESDCLRSMLAQLIARGDFAPECDIQFC